MWFLLYLIQSHYPGLRNPVPLFLGVLFVLEGLLIRTFGIDLIPEAASSGSLRRRRVPWSQVQAVLRDKKGGLDRVALILETGERVNLSAPIAYSWSGAGTAAIYVRDFVRIEDCWLAHRGPTWVPVRPEAPQNPARNQGKAKRR